MSVCGVISFLTILSFQPWNLPGVLTHVESPVSQPEITVPLFYFDQRQVNTDRFTIYIPCLRGAASSYTTAMSRPTLRAASLSVPDSALLPANVLF